MKKTLLILLSLALFAGVFTGCARQAGAVSTGEAAEGKKLQVVCTIFPEYDWVRQILGENAKNVELTMLLDNGVDLHSYQPTAEDMIKVSSCDMFVYVGGESDAWVADALKEATNKNMEVINLLDLLGDTVQEEELVEGMEPEAEEETTDATAEEAPEYDEHVWLSLKNARVICAELAARLSTLDPDHAEMYAANATDYTAQLDALDGEYQAAVDNARLHTVLFGDRFPFRYLVEDYGLDYYAAFVGCSAETEASFETVAFLAGKVDALGLNHVLTIEGAQHKIAETIIQNTAAKNQTVLVMDSMQATTSEDVQNGTTYLSVMENNLNVLKEALQ